ncbi:regulator of Ty1 Transposition [Coemansia sp. RSA 989]|nr:regulator of Ty1 Transposition [Coemansia sp. RSA 989]KAJ1874981.1 regulator of Ty1 Transposition [Coemansia sp. RSA 990]
MGDMGMEHSAAGPPANGQSLKAGPPMSVSRLQMSFSEAEQQSFVRRSDPVFANVVYWINPIYSTEEYQRIERLLQQGGAEPATFRHHKGGQPPDESRGAQQHKINGVLVQALPNMVSHISRFYLPQTNGTVAQNAATAPIRRATHVISPDTHFGEYAACIKAGVCVVTSQWVDRCFRVGWQYVERYFSPAAQDIFSGMVIAATHMPVSDKETLLASVMALGGQWREKLRPDVTHFILMKDEGSKYEFVKAHPEYGITPILPHWFKETLNLLRCIPQEPYVFPDPPVLHGQVTSFRGKMADESPISAALAVPSAETHNGAAYELPKPSAPFLQGYVLAISTQLRYSLSEGAISRLTQRLAEAGAEVLSVPEVTDKVTQHELPESLITDWNRVDILLCQHRSGYEYSKASRLGKVIGTFVWLYQAFLTGKITPPTQRLLHYPVPVTKVHRMDRLVITISHYTGPSRDYLQRLIIAMGAQYTPRMTRETTHLVTAMAEGRKYAAAIQWNIEVVNHLWVERCYQRWKLLSVSHPVFTHFPGLPVLNSMVGDTEIDVGRLASWVDPPQGEVLAETSDMELLNDSDLEVDYSRGAESNPSVIAVKTDTGHIYEVPPTVEQLQNGESESSDDIKSVAESADETGGAGQQPGSTGTGQARHTSRAAAMAASKTLNEMMKAANIFETEMRKERLNKYRKSGSGRRTLMLVDDEGMRASAIPTASQKGKAECSNKADNKRGGRSEGEAGYSDMNSSNKRQKTGNSGSDRVGIMFTQVRPRAEEQEQILAMGGEIVESATHATHLVCTSIKRTYKMLMALASGHVMIVGRNWLEDSLQQKRWIPVDFAHESEAAKYTISDQVAEKHWGFRLCESMRLSHERRLLEGITVFVTPSVEPTFSILKPLIEIAGGEAVTSLPTARLQTLLKKSYRAMHAKGATEATEMPLLVVTCREDSKMWPMFQLSADRRVPIYGTEVILTGLLRQRIQLNAPEFDLMQT